MIRVLPICSSLHDRKSVEKEASNLLVSLTKELNEEFVISDIDHLYDSDFSLILVLSGGSENIFLQNLAKLKPPFYLLTYGTNNSLAASLEILSYLKDHNLKGEVLHGDNLYLSKRIKELKNSVNLGVIGKPSDWLIASLVNYDDVKSLYNINLIDISIEEVIETYNKIASNGSFNLEYNKEELNKSYRLYLALKEIVNKYQLKGFTIRCFDLLSTLKTTACLSLAHFNDEGIIATCEGDIPTMLSMYIVKEALNLPSFQANPARIDIQNKKMVFAHCTIPFKMLDHFYLDTHYESKIGVAIKGYLKEDKITLFKLSSNLKDYYLDSGKILNSLDETNLCRTQIEIKVDNNIDYFLKRPYGNHHLIIYGDHVKELKNYLAKLR